MVIYSCLQVFISICLCKIKRSYFSQLYATVYSYSQIGGKLVVRLVVNLFVFVRVPTLQDFFHLSNKLLLVRHIQDIPGCKNLIRQTTQRILGCYAVLVSAEDDADRRMIFRVVDLCGVVVQLHIDLSGGFGRELGGFQLDQHIGV